MQSRQLTAFAKDFSNVKGKRPVLTPEVLDEIANGRIIREHLDLPAYLVPVMNGYKIHFNMEPTLDSGVFMTEKQALVVLDSYNESNRYTPKWNAWFILQKDALKGKIKQELYGEYSSNVLAVQNRQSDFLAHEAKKSIKSLMKGR